MTRPAGSVRRRALAALLGVLVLMSLAVDGCCGQPSPAAIGGGGGGAIGGRKVLPARALEDLEQDDPFLDSNRKVPNGPDPIHNRSAGKSGRSPGRA